MSDGRPYPSPAELLRTYGLSAKKGFGQNFLTDKNVTQKIARAVFEDEGASRRVTRGSVLEIGPGLGALTAALLEHAAHVVAVERDPDMVRVLEQEFAPRLSDGAFTLHQGDALETDWVALLEALPTPHAVVGNLPYLVTGRFLERAVELAHGVPRLVFMVQKEVGERLLSPPGTKEYGALTVFVAASFEVSRVMNVKSGAFLPKPAVDSMVVRLDRRAERVLETPTFRSLVRLAFGQRRKTLRNAWCALPDTPARVAAAADAAGVDLGRRGETLSLAEFTRVESALLALRAEVEAP